MYIYEAETIKQIDQQAADQGFSLFALMENAGRNIFEAMQAYLDDTDTILILAGTGNNGGDGMVLARYLHDAGFAVQLAFPLGEPKTSIAQAHLAYVKKTGVEVNATNEIASQATVLVDALLGVGVEPPLRKNAAEIVTWANQQDARRFAIDLPTGVAANHGVVPSAAQSGPGIAFSAEITFALHGAKPSAYLLPSAAFYGALVSVPIGLQQTSTMRESTEQDVQRTLPKRNPAGHKGAFGMSLLYAGTDSMPGSAVLAATGAIRSGTGKLMMGTTSIVASILAGVVPEATYMLDGLQTLNQTGNLPEKVSAIGIGPGLDDTAAIDQALGHILQSDLPVVVDAGALYTNRDWSRKATTVLTPHPGEFSTLTGETIPAIQQNRIALASRFAKEHDVILILKGKQTVIAFPDGAVRINPTGNTGLAKGGSGDVLTGMLTSFLSYDTNVYAAVQNAVYVHGLCANIWAETKSESSMTASDFQTLLPEAFHRLENNADTKV